MQMSQNQALAKIEIYLRFEPQKLIEGCLIAGMLFKLMFVIFILEVNTLMKVKDFKKQLDQAYEKNLIGKNAVELDGILIFISIMVQGLIYVEKKQLYLKV